ncbi:MAG: DUF922 domain-containing protein [Alphaproteobacteria bacterium]|nr:MAG: DUF922 domain-containing protein [Alphaproteobacteria bacterium]
MRLKRFLLLAALVAAFPQPCGAGVKENTAYNYYPVNAGQASLNEVLIAAYPLQKPGERFHAYTDWHIDWNFKYAANGGFCSMTSVDTVLTATMTLPKLESAPSADVQSRFDDYFPKLKLHEDGHLRIAQNAAAAIDSTLVGMRNVSCSTISSDANNLAYGILDRAKAAEKEYDLQTEHGKTQGAWLQ